MTGTQYFNMGANKMGMIANMILNFPVFQYQFLAFLLLEYTVINDAL